MGMQPSIFKQANWTCGDDITSFYFKDNRLYIGTAQEGLFVSNNNGVDWDKLLNYRWIQGIVSIGNTLIISSSEGISISSDNGSNWNVIETVGLNGGGNLFEKDGMLYSYSDTETEIYFSNDGGLHWNVIFDKVKAGYPKPPFPSFGVLSMGNIYDDIFIGTKVGFYVSKNAGDTWSRANNGFMPNNNTKYPDIPSLIPFELNLLAVADVTDVEGFSLNELFISTNFGANWSKISPNNMRIYCVLTIGQIIFAGTNEGVIISQDNGKSWVSFKDGLDPDFFVVQNIYAYNNTIIVKNIKNTTSRVYSAEVDEYLLTNKTKPVNLLKKEVSGIVSYRNQSDKIMYFYSYVAPAGSSYSFCDKIQVENEQAEVIPPGETSRIITIPPRQLLDARFFSSENCDEDNVLAESPVPYDQANGQVIDIYANKKK